jgi:hypothetical protein
MQTKEKTPNNPMIVACAQEWGTVVSASLVEIRVDVSADFSSGLTAAMRRAGWVITASRKKLLRATFTNLYVPLSRTIAHV